MFGLLALAATLAAIIVGYTQSRAFTRERLRFVDAVVNSKLAPILAGVAAAAVAAPLVALLPLVGTGTALLFGASVGVGVLHGSSDAKGGGGSWEIVSKRDS